MRNLTGILIYFNTIIKAIENPSTLYSQSIETIKQIFDEESVRIISRIYPYSFNGEYKLQSSGFHFIVNPNCKLPLKEIDLSNMNLERIPVLLARKMSGVERLNLSNNNRIRLNEEWFSYFYDNLKELSLKNCNLTDENLKAISNMKSLERLSLTSYIKKFNIKILEPILKNLRHLDLSFSGLTISELEYILNCADKLESLDFSGNNLADQTNLSAILSKRHNLKKMKLSGCALKFNDIQNIIQYSNLEEVDLSYNYLSHSNRGILEAIVDNHEDQSEQNNYNLGNSLNYNKQESNSNSKLKKINLNYCDLNNEAFIKSLFNIEGLEVLKLARNNLNFNMKEILNCKTQNSLKELDVSLCKIKSAETLKWLTDFKNLEKLEFSGYVFVNSPADFCFGKSKYSLKDLKMFYGELDSVVFKSITECTSLEKLDLSATNLGNIVPTDFNIENLRRTLKELNLSDCNINHNWLRAFSDCPQLEKIDFSHNDFSLLTREYSLGSSKNFLKEINLQGTNLNYEVLFDITDCPNLEKLNVSNNNFEGIPLDFKFGRSRESLKELNMDRVKLNSNGLLAISECRKIDKLIISHNNFSDLPNNFSFGFLEFSLRELIIFNTKINFICLDAISRCKKLEILDIRYNENIDIDDIKTRYIIEKLRRIIGKLDY